MTYFRTTSFVLIALVTSLCSAPARAEFSNFTAANACLPALPAYEGTIRKRPLSVQNEGTTDAFITCSLAADGFLQRVSLYANSTDGQGHIMTCTAVTGNTGGSVRYVTKAVLLQASGAQARLPLEPSDFGEVDEFNETLMSFSCRVSPGTGINDFFIIYE